MVLLGVAIAGNTQTPVSTDPSHTLEVYPDHYELAGTTYETTAALLPALRSLKNKKVLYMHWFAYANDKAKLDAIEIKVGEAARTAKAAGIPRTAVISNEVF